MDEVYEFTHGIYTSGHSLLPGASQSSLSGHEYKLKKRHCHSQLRVNFSRSVVNLWNKLPCDVVSAPSVNAFKGRLDNYCVVIHRIQKTFYADKQVNSQKVLMP